MLVIIADDLRRTSAATAIPWSSRRTWTNSRLPVCAFDRAYCQYPVCNPSRTSLLTGLRPDTTKVLGNNQQFPPRCPTWSRWRAHLRSGWFTASVGKIFHRGLTTSRTSGPRWTTRRRGISASTSCRPTRPARARGRNLTGGKHAWCRWLALEGDDADQHDGQVADEAVRLLEQKKDGPFFLAVGFNRPHDPFVAPKPLRHVSAGEALPARRSQERTPDLKHAISGGWIFDFGEQEKKEYMRAYWAGVSFMDVQAGKVLDAAPAPRPRKGPIVIFLGDHGFHLGERLVEQEHAVRAVVPAR